MLPPLIMEVMTSYCVLPVWHPLHMPLRCWHHDLVTLTQTKQVKVTAAPLPLYRLLAVQRHSRRVEMNFFWAAVNQPRQSVLKILLKEYCAPLPSVWKRSEMIQQRWTAWQMAAWEWWSLKTGLIGLLKRRHVDQTAWKASSHSRGATVIWPVLVWPSQLKMAHWQLAVVPVLLNEAPCLKTGRATPTLLDMKGRTARPSPMTGMLPQQYTIYNIIIQQEILIRISGLVTLQYIYI